MAHTNVRNGSPPSSYAMHSLISGEPGSVGRVVEATLLRTLFVLPGLYLFTPYRGRRLVTTSLAASASITFSLMVYYTMRKNGWVDDED